MNKFTGPARIPTYEPKNKLATTTTKQYSSSTHTASTGPGQTTTTTRTSSAVHSMTYSALPKPQEPPVNSAAYFELLQQGSPSATPSAIQQSAATPPHIQGPAPGFGALRDRFKAVSVSDDTNSAQDTRRQQSSASGSGLSSLRNQYINRAQESTQTQEESFSQRIQHVSRTIAGEDPAQHRQQQQQQQHQQQQQQQPQPQQETAAAAPLPPPATPENLPQEEPQAQSQSVDDQAASSEGAVADGGSSSGASSLENDNTSTTPAAAPASN